MAEKNLNTFDNATVIATEDEVLKLRRKKLFGEEDAAQLDDTRFGIALSGGGIRSATINMGFLKTLNNFGILKRADYLSTVSGGGYTGSYIQGTIKNYKAYKEEPTFDAYKKIEDQRYFAQYKAFKSKMGRKSEDGKPIFSGLVNKCIDDLGIDLKKKEDAQKFEHYTNYLEYASFEPYRDYLQNKEQGDFLAFKKFAAFDKFQIEKDYKSSDAYRSFSSFSGATTGTSAYQSCEEILDAEKYFQFAKVQEHKVSRIFCDESYIAYQEYIIHERCKDDQMSITSEAYYSDFQKEADSYTSNEDYEFFKELLKWQSYYAFLELMKATDYSARKESWNQPVPVEEEKLGQYKRYLDYAAYREIKASFQEFEAATDFEAFLDYEALKTTPATPNPKCRMPIEKR